MTDNANTITTVGIIGLGHAGLQAVGCDLSVSGMAPLKAGDPHLGDLPTDEFGALPRSGR